MSTATADIQTLAINTIRTLSMDGVQAANSGCLLYTSPSPRDLSTSRMPSSA